MGAGWVWDALEVLSSAWIHYLILAPEVSFSVQTIHMQQLMPHDSHPR
jgi:hypothetical protein